MEVRKTSNSDSLWLVGCRGAGLREYEPWRVNARRAEAALESSLPPSAFGRVAEQKSKKDLLHCLRCTVR